MWYYACCGQRSMNAHVDRSGAPSQVEDPPFAERAVVPEPRKVRVRGPAAPVGQQADADED